MLCRDFAGFFGIFPIWQTMTTSSIERESGRLKTRGIFNDFPVVAFGRSRTRLFQSRRPRIFTCLASSSWPLERACLFWCQILHKSEKKIINRSHARWLLKGKKTNFRGKKKFQKTTLTFGLGFQFGGFFLKEFFIFRIGSRNLLLVNVKSFLGWLQLMYHQKIEKKHKHYIAK